MSGKQGDKMSKLGIAGIVIPFAMVVAALVGARASITVSAASTAVICLLLVIEVIVLAILFFRGHPGPGKVALMAVPGAVLLALTAFMAYSELTLIGAPNFLDLHVTLQPWTAWAGVGAFVVAFLWYGAVVIGSDELLVMPVFLTGACLIVCAVVIPFIVYLVGNAGEIATGAVSVVTGAVKVVLIVGLAAVVAFIFSGSSASASVPPVKAEPRTNAGAKPGGYVPTPGQTVKSLSLNTNFWRSEGPGHGDALNLGPTADCVYYTNAYGQDQYACTVRQFEEGSVAIVNKGIRVTDIAGCKRPAK